MYVLDYLLGSYIYMALCLLLAPTLPLSHTLKLELLVGRFHAKTGGILTGMDL